MFIPLAKSQTRAKETSNMYNYYKQMQTSMLGMWKSQCIGSGY